MTRAPDESTPLDVRLVAPALAGWLATGVAVVAGALAATALAGGCVVAAAVVVHRHRQQVWAAGLLATLAVCAGFAVATALRADAASDHPVLGRGGSQLLELRLTDDPRVLRGGPIPGAPPRVLAPARLVADEDHVHLSGAVVILAPAEGWLGLLPGQQVRVRASATPPRRHDLTVAAVQVRGPPELVGSSDRVQRAAGALRDGLREAAGRTLGPDEAGLLPGLVLGDTSALPDEVLADARTAGLTHLTAVSGTNITIVLGAVVILVRLLGAGPRTCAVCAGVALVGFVILVRPSPSVLRAAVMGSIALLALVTGRRRQAVPALGGAVLVLLAVRPALAVDAGFALSVLATAGLVLLAPGWALALRDRGVPVGVAELVAVPVAAHVVTAPVIAGISGEFSVVAVLANLLVAPAVGIATVVGVLATLVVAVWTPGGEFLVRLAGPEVWWIVHVGRWSAGLPNAAVSVPGGVAGALGLAAVTVALLALLRHRRARWTVLAIALGATLVLLPSAVVSPGWPAQGWAMVACDVGLGDGLVLAQGPGRGVVVDVGTEPEAIGGCLDRLGITEVPLVILTHLHLDHIGGLAGALDGRAVGAVAVGPLHLPDETLGRVRSTAQSHGVPVVDLRAGQRLEWPELTLDVLGPTRAPPRTLGGDEGTTLNDASLVLAAQTSAGRILLTGDVELSAQADLVSRADLRADVLKVAHHGSAVGLPEFLDAIEPRVAVISVGQGNTYGHPSPTIVDHLTRQGVLVERTDLAGDVAIVDGRDGPTVVERGDPRPPP